MCDCSLKENTERDNKMNSTEFIENGEKYIQQAIDNAVQNGSKEATVMGNYRIYETVYLPSDFTLYLKDCRLVMGDNTFCQMFSNQKVALKGKMFLKDCDKNINIIGLGNVVLDGGKYNGLSEKNYKNSPYFMTANNTVFFRNVDGFRIENVKVVNQRWWALNFVYCRNGVLKDIDFCADCTRTVDGKTVWGLTHDDYDSITIKNADGIDLRTGCHDISIENVTGFTEDDTIALTTLGGGFMETLYKVEDGYNGIYNIRIKHIRSSAFCTIVRLLSQGGTELHDIDIEDVQDTSADKKYFDRGLYALRIGDTHRYSQAGDDKEVYNVRVNGVTGCGTAVVHTVGNMDKNSFENIRSFGDCNTEWTKL